MKCPVCRKENVEFCSTTGTYAKICDDPTDEVLVMSHHICRDCGHEFYAIEECSQCGENVKDTFYSEDSLVEHGSERWGDGVIVGQSED